MENCGTLLNRILNILSDYSAIKDKIIREKIYSGLEYDLSNCFLTKEDIDKIKNKPKNDDFVCFLEVFRLTTSPDTLCIEELTLIENEILNMLENENLYHIECKIMDIKDRVNNIPQVRALRSRGFF